MEKQIHVLFLDDEGDILNSFRRAFVTEPFAVATVADPEEAIAVIMREPIKVVVSDQRMPSVTGVEFLHRVKALKPEVMRILFTAYTDVETAEQAINLGEVFRFIAKPWDLGDLKTAIRQAMEHYDLLKTSQQLFVDLKKQNEDLEILNRKLKTMYENERQIKSMLSHELKTPLAVVKMSIDILDTPALGPLNELQRDLLKKAKEYLGRLNVVADEILGFSRVQGQVSQLDIQQRNLREVIEGVMAVQEIVARNKGLSLRLEVPVDVPLIPMDATKMAQVFNQLVGQAIQLTKEGEITVHIRHRQEGNHVEVCIEDGSDGVWREDIVRLYQDQGPKEPGVVRDGPWKELTVCQEIIRQHGGKSWIESGESRGNRFRVIMPVSERRAE